MSITINKVNIHGLKPLGKPKKVSRLPEFGEHWSHTIDERVFVRVNPNEIPENMRHIISDGRFYSRGLIDGDYVYTNTTYRHFYVYDD